MFRGALARAGVFAAIIACLVVLEALSLAGEARPGQSGQASSAVTVIGYGGFLAGPAIIGGAAELTDLRLALGLVVVAGIGIAGIGQWLVRGLSR